MSATMTHSLRAIEISLKKTYSRLSELEESNDPAVAGEVLETLSLLEGWRNTLLKWRDDNPRLFSNKEK